MLTQRFKHLIDYEAWGLWFCRLSVMEFVISIWLARHSAAAII